MTPAPDRVAEAAADDRPADATRADTTGRRIGEFDRSGFQRAARTLLRHPLITTTYPTAEELPLVRRWAVPLAADFGELFGYRLEITSTTARLVRVRDELDGSRPAVTRTGRAFDRRRYAYLALTLAVLDRSGAQIALSELATRVAGEAKGIDGLELSAERAADRAAFVDAVAWFEERGALHTADGSARTWVDDPTTGEALYDIERDVVRAVYRPRRVLQHLSSVADLLGTSSIAGADPERETDPAGDGPDASRREATSGSTARRLAGQRVRRALVENPVVYFDGLDPALHGMLRSPRAADDVAALTGANVERRAEGVLVLDVAAGLTDRRFPGPGTVSQAALLLLVAICDRIDDVDAPALPKFPLPPSVSRRLVSELDDALPRSGVLRPGDGPHRRFRNDSPVGEGEIDEYDEGFAGIAVESADGTAPTGEPGGAGGSYDRGADRYPFLDTAWLTEALAEIIDRYGKTFAARWLADTDGLLDEATSLLADLRMVEPTSGGILALPLLARYRNAVVDIRHRATGSAEQGLFET